MDDDDDDKPFRAHFINGYCGGLGQGLGLVTVAWIAYGLWRIFV